MEKYIHYKTPTECTIRDCFVSLYDPSTCDFEGKLRGIVLEPILFYEIECCLTKKQDKHKISIFLIAEVCKNIN